jgi:hypothetical protein
VTDEQVLQITRGTKDKYAETGPRARCRARESRGPDVVIDVTNVSLEP